MVLAVVVSISNPSAPELETTNFAPAADAPVVPIPTLPEESLYT